MSLFCLIHGSTQNASGWDLLIPELRQLGHQTIQVDLPVTETEATASRYAGVIAEALSNCDDIVLVAHSASGLFLPLVPAIRPIRRLVFLAAAIPRIGMSLLDQVKSTPDMFHPEWLGKDPTQNDGLARHFLFHDCSPEVTNWALSTRRLMNARQAILEICPLQTWPAVPSSYIVCNNDRTFQPAWSRRAARELLGVDAIELPGGHCPHVSRPAALAQALHSLTAA